MSVSYNYTRSHRPRSQQARSTGYTQRDQRGRGQTGLGYVQMHGIPNVHDALDIVSAAALGVGPGTVVEVREPGYCRKERLFRPARVVVAQ
jgi:hypothetical protein